MRLLKSLFVSKSSEKLEEKILKIVSKAFYGGNEFLRIKVIFSESIEKLFVSNKINLDSFFIKSFCLKRSKEIQEGRL